MTADVTQGYLNLVTAARTVELQEVNAQKAREELTYAQERYRVGAATFLDVTTSERHVRAGAGRSNQRDLRLSSGVRRAGSRGRPPPPLSD